MDVTLWGSKPLAGIGAHFGGEKPVGAFGSSSSGKLFWDPMLVGIGEFTTHFRLPILVGIGMFTGGTIWILTHVSVLGGSQPLVFLFCSILVGLVIGFFNPPH